MLASVSRDCSSWPSSPRALTYLAGFVGSNNLWDGKNVGNGVLDAVKSVSRIKETLNERAFCSGAKHADLDQAQI